MKRFIIILVILFCANLNAGVKQKAENAIKTSEDIIQEASEDIPAQFKFNANIKYRIGEADNSLAVAKKELANKKYSRAVANANNAEVLSVEAMEISEGLVERMESEILDKINVLKNKVNDDLSKAMIFEAENLFQQKNYYECIKKIEEIKDYVVKRKKVKNLKRSQSRKKIRKIISLKRKYRVNIGDSLWKIAKKVYKNPLKWVTIYKANKSIKNINLIFPGQILNLPGK